MRYEKKEFLILFILYIPVEVFMVISSYLTIPPNWAEKVSLSHVWQTSILNLLRGAEQRSGLFTRPRLKMSYQLDLLDAAQMRWWRRNLHRHQHEIWGVPIWPDNVPLTAPAAAGQKIIGIASTSNRHHHYLGLVILIAAHDPMTFEVGTVTGLHETWVRLAANLTQDWPAGSLLYPLVPFRLAAEIEETVYVPAMIGIQLSLVEAVE